MNRIIKRIFQILLLSFVMPVAAQQISIITKIDTNSILIGDQIKLKYIVNSPVSNNINFPVFNDKLTDKVDIVSQSNIDTVYSQNKLSFVLTKTISLTSFDSGAYVIPSFTVQYIKKNDTSVYQIFTDSVYLNVNVIPVDTTLAIKDIKAPFNAPLTFKELLPYILGGIGLILLILVTIYLIRRFNKKKNNISEPPKPKIPPYKKALQDFETLRLKKLWQNNNIKEYHSELTEILRVYFEQQLNIQALEQTTDETLEAFASVIHDKVLLEKLSEILTLADLVKFAKQLPLPDQHDLSLKYAIDIVKETYVNSKKETNLENPENSNNN